MVSNVTFVQDGLKYIQGMPVVEKGSSIASDVKSSAVMGSIFGAPGAIGDMWGNRKILGGKGEGVVSATKKYSSEIAHKGLNSLQYGSQNLDGLNLLKTIDKMDDFAGKENLRNSVSQALKMDDAKAARAILNDADDFVKATSKAASQAAKATKTGFFATVGKGFSKVTGAIKDGASKLFNKIPGFTKLAESSFGKAFAKSGAILSLGIEGTMQVCTEVIPAFKELGAGEGVKQVGKSALTVGASVGGWVGGAKLGGIIGSAICPVIGTIVGGIVGMVGGMIGASVATGIAKKVTGESASEKIAKKQEAQQAEMIAQDPNAVAELEQYVVQKIAAEQQAGQISEDTMKMAQQLDAMKASQPTTAVSQAVTSQPSTTAAAYNPFDATATVPATSNINVDPSIYAVPPSVKQPDFSQFVTAA